MVAWSNVFKDTPGILASTVSQMFIQGMLTKTFKESENPLGYGAFLALTIPPAIAAGNVAQKLITDLLKEHPYVLHRLWGPDQRNVVRLLEILRKWQNDDKDIVNAATLNEMTRLAKLITENAKFVDARQEIARYGISQEDFQKILELLSNDKIFQDTKPIKELYVNATKQTTECHRNIANNTIKEFSDIKNDTSFNVKDSKGKTLLHHAVAKKWSTSDIRQLVKKMDQENIDAQDDEKQTALHCALSSGCDDDVILVLLNNMSAKAIKMIDKNSEQASLVAAAKGKHELAKLINRYEEGQTAVLIHRAKEGNIQDMQTALDFGADVNGFLSFGTDTPLTQVVEHFTQYPNSRPKNFLDVIIFLLSKGADPKKPTALNEDAIDYAQNDKEILEIFKIHEEIMKITDLVKSKLTMYCSKNDTPSWFAETAPLWKTRVPAIKDDILHSLKLDVYRTDVQEKLKTWAGSAIDSFFTGEKNESNLKKIIQQSISGDEYQQLIETFRQEPPSATTTYRSRSVNS